MKRLLGFVGILMLGWVNLAFGGTVTVSGTSTVFTTIQAGVNACPEGGTVSVAAGTYTEVIYINKGIALIGIGTPTIDASGLGATNTVTFTGSNTNNAVIFGVVITGATGTGSIGNGIYCKNNAGPTIINNIISGNNHDGIDCNSSSPSITNNIVAMNGVYGIQCSDSSSPFIINNILTGNIEDGIYCSSSFSIPTITNNTISGNGGHGIWCGFSSSPIITNNIITGNGTTNAGYGIYLASGTPTINYNDVWGNNGLPTTYNYHNCGAGTYDISTNPQFIGEVDYHLQSTSPCINKGTSTAPNIPITDKDGNPRIIGNIVDMGAY
ncbi:MAG: right-handed parallel beta-helix repeat-containing protein, partial [Candidatus Desantisbacteria bacterium]